MTVVRPSRPLTIENENPVHSRADAIQLAHLGIFERVGVFADTGQSGFQIWHDLLGADHQDKATRAIRDRADLGAGGRGEDQGTSWVRAWAELRKKSGALPSLRISRIWVARSIARVFGRRASYLPLFSMSSVRPISSMVTEAP